MSQRDVLRQQTAAFNAKDADRLGELLTEDYDWYQVGEDGPHKVAAGRAATVERLRAFFAAMPYASSTIGDSLEVGNLIAAVERDTFTHEGRAVERTTLGVYEYRDGRLRRAWAFPVEF